MASVDHPESGDGQSHTRQPSDEFDDSTTRDVLVSLERELQTILSTEPDEAKREATRRDMQAFSQLYRRFLRERGPSVVWDKVERPPPDTVRDYNTLAAPSEETIAGMLNKLVVVKLNGGLGTSMGCRGPKSVIAVRNERSFLDLTVEQVEHLNRRYKAKVPLVLMNSFNTHAETQRLLGKYAGLQVKIYSFVQSCFPRIHRDSLLPLATDASVQDNANAWYPPGHGDFYESFARSGLLQVFLSAGFEYCFLSNIDNLGATVDVNILHLLCASRPEFLMEVTDRTPADVKGGTLVQCDGKLRLLEVAQVPSQHRDDFKSIRTFKWFNTNNLWVKLAAIERVLKSDLQLEIIVNSKTIEGNVSVIQLETAVGAAIKHFDGQSINVPRSRFLPVKKTSDLMLVMSNVYSVQHGCLLMSPQRTVPTTPSIRLVDTHFCKVDEFLARFGNIPDLLELDQLTVSGDVTFGRGVSLRGSVIIVAHRGDRIDIPAGAVLENKIVSGNLRILEQ